MIGVQHALYPSMLVYTTPVSSSPNATSRSSTPSASRPSAPPDHATSAIMDPADVEKRMEESLHTGKPHHIDEPVLESLGRRHAEHPAERDHPSRKSGRAAMAFSSRSSERPRIVFSDLAASIRQKGFQDRRFSILQRRRKALQRSVALSGRLVRTTGTVQKGLYESLKFLDSPSFVAVYNAMQELRRRCESSWKRDVQVSEPPPEDNSALPSYDDQSVTYLQRLSKKSQEDLFAILQLVRTSSDFLVDRLRCLTTSQISNIATFQSVQSGKISSVFSSTSKGRSPASHWNRNMDHLLLPKEQALAFERNDPLAALLHNVFASPISEYPQESHTRLAVWSSTCAELFFDQAKDFRAFVGEVVTSFAWSSEWRAKQEVELFLMERLQHGAALLERVNSANASTFEEPEYVDAMSTDLASEFFDTAVKNLFRILDDFDGGFPRGALEIGSAILGKLGRVDRQSDFRGFLFFQWYFCNFLPSVIIHPESHGMLLEYHISADAREKLLRGIYLRAQAQVFSFSNPIYHPSSNPSELDERTESMISRLIETEVPLPVPDSASESIETISPVDRTAFVILSAADMICVLDTLFPRQRSVLSTCDPAPAPAVSVFSAQSHLGRTLPETQCVDSLHPENVNFPAFAAPSIASEAVRERTNHFTSRTVPNSGRNELSRKADRVRRAILDIIGMEERPALAHPCTEDWAVICIAPRTQHLTCVSLESAENDKHGPLHRETAGRGELLVQDAVQRLIRPGTEPLDIGSLSIHSFDSSNHPLPLEDMFNLELDRCQSQSDLVGEHYWSRALQALRRCYPLSCLVGDDTKVLQPMFDSSNASLRQSEPHLLALENEVSGLQESFEQLMSVLKTTTSSLERLRNKMWYMHDVKNSAAYESSKNVALALKNMALPAELMQQATTSITTSRTLYRSLAGSLLQKPEVQTLNIMKASIEHGGPKKLADDQIELTRKWLSRYGIENFCKGEERIHRFCFEMKTLVGNLIGENMMDGRILWSSDLYAHERALFERQTGRSLPSYGSARPSSIVSDEGSLTGPFAHTGQRTTDTVSRLQSSENTHTPTRKASFQSVVSDRWRSSKDSHPNDNTSISDSPSKAVSTSTMESVSTFWSPFQTNAQSAASASSYHSRPSSLFNEVAQSRQIDENAPAKALFLESLKQILTSLLLSDLGSPTWNRDSETDRWFSWATGQEGIRSGVDKLARITRLLSKEEDRELSPSKQRTRAIPQLRHQRSISAGPVLGHRDTSPRSRSPTKSHFDVDEPGFSYETAFGSLVERCSRHANPMLKLQALHDLKKLIIYSLEDDASAATDDCGVAGSRTRPDSRVRVEPRSSRRRNRQPPSESRIVHALKQVLFDTKPKTIFRDLQFISAFVPSEVLNKSERGKAFLHVGLAALSLKDDVCKVMVGMADKMVAQGVDGRQTSDLEKKESILKTASQYWMFAAKEENAVAQRELAILYLTHPEVLPRITQPLTLSKDTFKSEMEYWPNNDGRKSDSPTMCLALHWMQLSANNGDVLAKTKLRERGGFDSLI